MAKPQVEDGPIRIANELWDALCRAQLTGRQFQILHSIIRYTYGWRKKSAPISLGAFKKLTGIQDHSWLLRTLQVLEQKHIITTERRSGLATIYGVQKDYEQWTVVIGNTCDTSDTCVVGDSTTCDASDSTTCDVHDTPHLIRESTKTCKEKKDPSPPSSVKDVSECRWCASPRQETSGVHYLLQYWHDSYKKHLGICPTINPPKDAGILKRLLTAGRTAEQIAAAMDRYFTDGDEFISKQGYPLSLFSSRIDAYRQNGARQQRKRSWV